MEFCFPVLALMGLRDVLQACKSARTALQRTTLGCVGLLFALYLFQGALSFKGRMMPTTANFLVHK